jgi:hypothetical protein
VVVLAPVAVVVVDAPQPAATRAAVTRTAAAGRLLLALSFMTHTLEAPRQRPVMEC